MSSRKLKALIWIAHHLEAAFLIERYVQLAKEELESHGHKVVIARDLEDAIAAVKDADIMLCWKIVPEIFMKAERLKWIQLGSAGIEHTLFPELIESDVILTNVSGIHRAPASEHALGLMLALSRRLNVSMRLQIEHRYDRSPISPTAGELRGKTVGILGLGKIGLELARVCKSLGMTVIGTKKSVAGKLDNVDKIFTVSDLDILLRESDYVVLVLPLTISTRSLIGQRELDLMKPIAFIINIARGQMIDEIALISALREGKLAGAALDVFTEEPLPSDSPLYDLPNVILTPHVAGSHPEYPERAFGIFKANLNAFERNRPLANVFDRKRGY